KQFSSDTPAQGIDPRALTDAGSGDTIADDEGPLPLSKFDNAAQFARITSSRAPVIDFVGVWDTVASVIVPRSDKWFWVPSLEELAFTIANPSVRVFRQAIAIDERRRMFRLKPWDDPQTFLSNPWQDPRKGTRQDILQVWFAGVHADIGGGYKEAESQVSKYPLLWMIDEAVKCGLTANPSTVNQLAWGVPRKGSPFTYVEPHAAANMHNSMNLAWRLLECIPKRSKFREWQKRWSLLGLYIPGCEPRFIPDGAVIHQSVEDRMADRKDYRPVNLPENKNYRIFDNPKRPQPHGAAAGGV